MWLYIVVAAGIALAAFAIGQTEPGLGVPFVAFATVAWTALSFALRRHRSHQQRF